MGDHLGVTAGTHGNADGSGILVSSVPFRRCSVGYASQFDRGITNADACGGSEHR